VPQDVLDQWVLACEAELDSLKLHSWKRLRMLWGLRNDVDAVVPVGSAATEARPQTLLQPSAWVPHQQVHFYRTPQECQDARNKRMDSIGEVIEPLVLAQIGE